MDTLAKRGDFVRYSTTYVAAAIKECAAFATYNDQYKPLTIIKRFNTVTLGVISGFGRPLGATSEFLLFCGYDDRTEKSDFGKWEKLFPFNYHSEAFGEYQQPQVE